MGITVYPVWFHIQSTESTEFYKKPNLRPMNDSLMILKPNLLRYKIQSINKIQNIEKK